METVQSQTSQLSEALASLNLEDEQLEEKSKVEGPCHEVEDGWMMLKNDIDVWNFTEEVGELPD
jgi:hypothetical protein